MENSSSSTSNSNSTEDQATVKTLTDSTVQTISLQDVWNKIKHWFSDFIPTRKQKLPSQPSYNQPAKLKAPKKIQVKRSSLRIIAQKWILLYKNIEKQDEKISSLVESIEDHDKFHFHTIGRLSRYLYRIKFSELKVASSSNQGIDITKEIDQNAIVWPKDKIEINTKSLKINQESAEYVIKCVHEVHHELFKNLNSFFRSRCKKYIEIRGLSNYRASYYNMIVDRTLKWLEITKENWFDICKRKEFIQKCLSNPVLLEVGDYLLKFNKDVEICMKKLENYIKKMTTLENSYGGHSGKVCTFCGYNGHDRRSCKEIKKAFCKQCLDYNSHTTKYHEFLYGS